MDPDSPISQSLWEVKLAYSNPLNYLNRLLEDGILVQMVNEPNQTLPILSIQPKNLLTAMVLQLAERLQMDAQDQRLWVECEWWGSGFRVGPGTGRRSTARFCDRKCQQKSRQFRTERNYDYPR